MKTLNLVCHGAAIALYFAGLAAGPVAALPLFGASIACSVLALVCLMFS